MNGTHESEITCTIWAGKPESHQLEAAVVYDRAGLSVQTWEWVSSTCGEPLCLTLDHLVVHKPLKLAYPWGVCTYCGLPGNTRDHILPRTHSGEALRRYVATVPACGQCNSILGDRGGANITIRRRLAHEGIARKNAGNLATKDWTKAELREFGPTLRSAIEKGLRDKAETVARLAWPHDLTYDLRALELSGIPDPYATGLLGGDTEYAMLEFATGRLRTSETFEKRRRPNKGMQIRLLADQGDGRWSAQITYYPDRPARLGKDIFVASSSLRGDWGRVPAARIAS